MTPEEAVDRFLKEKKARSSDSTYYNYSSMLNQLLDSCEQEELTNVSNLDGFRLSDFKMHRRDEDGSTT